MKLAEMAYLKDTVMWKVARTTLSREQQERLQVLHDKQQRIELTPGELIEEQALVKLYREALLASAQAVALLQHRGYDVSDPLQFYPLD